MLTGAVAFSGMAAFTHSLKADIDWQVIAVIRSLFACLLSFALAQLAGAKLVIWSSPVLWIRSLAGSLSVLGTFYALTHLPIADVLTLTNLFPIWVAILSWPLLRERPGIEAWCALASGIAGVYFIQQPHLAEGNIAVLIALSVSFTTAVAMLGLNRLQHIDSRAIVMHFSGVSVIVCTAVWFVWGNKLHTLNWTPQSCLRLLGVGLCATFGQLCLTNAFKSGPATQVSVVGLSQVGFAMLLDYFLWHRQFNTLTLIGIALVMGPTAWLLIRAGMQRSTPPNPEEHADL